MSTYAPYPRKQQRPMVKSYFAVIGQCDECIYDFESSDATKGEKDAAFGRLRQLIAHAALDNVDQSTRLRGDYYFPRIDTFQDLFVSAYVPIGPVKFVLVQDREPDASVQELFQRAHEVIIRHTANPFASLTSPVAIPAIKERLREVCRSKLPCYV